MEVAAKTLHSACSERKHGAGVVNSSKHWGLIFRATDQASFNRACFNVFYFCPLKKAVETIPIFAARCKNTGVFAFLKLVLGQIF